MHALDYLTKPVEPERLKATLEHVKERIASRNAVQTHEQFKSLLAALTEGVSPRKEYAGRLIVPNGPKDSFVNVDEIEWIEAAGLLRLPARRFQEFHAPRNHQATGGDP